MSVLLLSGQEFHASVNLLGWCVW